MVNADDTPNDGVTHQWTDIEGIQITFARHCKQDLSHAHHVLNEAFSEPIEDIADLFADDNRTALNTTGEMNAVRRLKALIISTIEQAAYKTATKTRVSVLIDPLPMSYFRIMGNRDQQSFIRSPKNLEAFLDEANKHHDTVPEVRLNINSLFFRKGFMPEDFGDINDKAFPVEPPFSPIVGSPTQIGAPQYSPSPAMTSPALNPYFNSSGIPQDVKQRYEDHKDDDVLVTKLMMTRFDSTVPNISLDITGNTKRKVLVFSDGPNRVITRSGHTFQLYPPDERSEKAFIANTPRLTSIQPDTIRNWYDQLTEHARQYGIYIHPYYCFRKSTGSSRGFTCGDDSDSSQYDLPAHLFHKLDHWSSKIFLALSKEGVLPEDTDLKSNAIGRYGTGYEGLYSIISGDHPECNLYPSTLLGNRPRQEKLSLSKYYDKYKDWLLQRAYLENNSATLNVDSEMDNFIKGLVYEKQYFKLTRDARNSRDPSIRAKYSQGRILVTLQSFDSLIDKLPPPPASPLAIGIVPRYSTPTPPPCVPISPIDDMEGSSDDDTESIPDFQ